jgi:hypothetical protein
MDASEHRTGAARTLNENREPDRCQHEDHRGPSRHLRQQVGGAARSEGCLRALSAKGAGKIRALALLQKNDGDEEDAVKNVYGAKEPHHKIPDLSRGRASQGISVTVESIWCGRGDLNPHASRRHPLKMVCLPISPLPQGRTVILPRLPEDGHNASLEHLHDWCIQSNALVLMVSRPATYCNGKRPAWRGPAPTVESWKFLVCRGSVPGALRGKRR